MSRFVITGAVGGSTAGALAPNRLEINDFVKIEDQFSLYVQALQAISTESQNDLTSFFQIGGIHGLPYVSWDGSGQKPVSTEGWEGYCTHGSVLFPTWHRPYMMLYEQVLQSHAKDIAAKYTVDKDRWSKAAANLRQPYWDWASNTIPPPEVISLQQVTITTFNGSKVKVDNPLVRYKFHPIDPSFPQPYSNWPTTLRHATSNDANAKDNVDELKRTLASVQSDVTSKIYNLLTRVHTWPAFSNHTPGDGGSSSNSLEAIHDGIHVDVGGNGQMSDPSVAGFDPIFFLHHANVDRMLSLWAALNPNVWVTSGPAEDGTWTIPPTATIDKNTSLTPFWDKPTGYWPSSAVEMTGKLGYTYPEFNGLDMGNPNAVKAALAQIVNKLYGGPSTNRFVSLAAQAPARGAAAGQSQSLGQQPKAGAQALANAAPAQLVGQAGASNPQTASVQSFGSSANVIWEWTARIHIEQYAIGGSFSVLLFLGNVPSNPDEWRTSPNFVGAHHAFVNSVPAHCANCRRQGGLVVEGFVHLNEGIARLSGLGSLEPDVVKPYLTKELHWVVQKVDGTSVPLADVPSLEVTVIATPLSLEPGEVFPVPGDAVHHHDVTHGRQGGSRHA
ncbi:photo-regulated tyrosinase [Dentipellis sp. KUC8613]|nr:photo-regulated tyrosinase [Dentipellis sp. KUC8613]